MEHKKDIVTYGQRIIFSMITTTKNTGRMYTYKQKPGRHRIQKDIVTYGQPLNLAVILFHLKNKNFLCTSSNVQYNNCTIIQILDKIKICVELGIEPTTPTHEK